MSWSISQKDVMKRAVVLLTPSGHLVPTEYRLVDVTVTRVDGRTTVDGTLLGTEDRVVISPGAGTLTVRELREEGSEL